MTFINFAESMSIRKKVTFALVAVALLLIAVLIITAYLFTGVKTVSVLFIPAAGEMKSLNDISTQVELLESDIERYSFTKDESVKESFSARIAKLYLLVENQYKHETNIEDIDEIFTFEQQIKKIDLDLEQFDKTPISEMDVSTASLLIDTIIEDIERLKELTAEHTEEDLVWFSERVIEQNNLIDDLARWVSISTLIILLSVTTLALYILRTVVKPIIDLRDAVEALPKKSSRKALEVSSNDEVGQLTSAFNTMIKQVFTAQENLEKKVKDRTSELEIASAAMEHKVSELEKFKQLTVDRELQMIDLKKQIKRGDEDKNNIV